MTEYDPNSNPIGEATDVFHVSDYKRYVIDHDRGVVYAQVWKPASSPQGPPEVKLEWETTEQMSVETLLELVDRLYTGAGGEQ